MPINKLTPEQIEFFNQVEDPDFPRQIVNEQPEPFEPPPGARVVPLEDCVVPADFLRAWRPFRSPSPEVQEPPRLTLPIMPATMLPALDSRPREHPLIPEYLNDEGVEDGLETFELPVDDDVKIIKQFIARVPRETSFDRPAAVEGNKFEVDYIGAIGRDGRRIVLLVKWLGYPWTEATWEYLNEVSQEAKDNLVAVWGPLGRITSDSQPVQVADEEEVVAEPPKKKARITYATRDRTTL